MSHYDKWLLIDCFERVFKEFQNEYEKESVIIIDKIIEVNPSTIRLDPNQRFYTADTKAKESLIENEELVTETLAKIYALQGNISKAVRAYEILSLKFPQKSAYFATLIQNLKKQSTGLITCVYGIWYF